VSIVFPPFVPTPPRIVAGGDDQAYQHRDNDASEALERHPERLLGVEPIVEIEHV
jgi:hypothetical protein